MADGLVLVAPSVQASVDAVLIGVDEGIFRDCGFDVIVAGNGDGGHDDTAGRREVTNTTESGPHGAGLSVVELIQLEVDSAAL